MMQRYLAIGCVWYVAMALYYSDSFKGAKPIDVVKGFVFGVFLWPVSAAVHIARLMKL